jgi:hypothetical protein
MYYFIIIKFQTVLQNLKLNKMSGFTYISSTEINNYETLESLQETIIRTIARWFGIQGAVWSEIECTYGIYQLCGIERLQAHFEVYVSSDDTYRLTMHAVGNFRRHGSSCDYFENLFDCLEYQLGHKDIEFVTMETASLNKRQCEQEYTSVPEADYDSGDEKAIDLATEQVLLTTEDDAKGLDEQECERCAGWGCSTSNRHTGYTRSEVDTNEAEEDEESVASSDEDSDDEDDRIMTMPLRDMTDKQIDRYIYFLGREPRDECDEWEMDYAGDAIIRYSYVNFADTTIADRWVFNVTIRRARFAGCTLRNFQFEQVHFHECDFKSVILENVTFKDCQFTECDLDISISLDNSCSVENYDYEEEMRQEFLEDNVTYRYC